jgi:integrase
MGMVKRWTERDIQLIRGSTSKPWVGLGNSLYLRVHQGTDGRTYKSFYWRGGKTSAFRALGSWPDLSLANARLAIAEIKSGKRQVSSTASFAIAADGFFAHQGTDLRQATLDTNMSVYITHLRDSLGPRKLRELTAGDVSQLLGNIARDGKRETAIKAASLVRRILDRAVVDGLVVHNVASSLRAAHLGGRSPARKRVLDDEEIVRFLKASHNHPRGNVVRFLLATGCRVNETVKSETAWLKDNLLTIPASVTKQKREHRVTLSKYARRQLRHLESTSPYLFPSPFHKGRDPQSREAAWLATNTLFKAAKIIGATAHDLRRTARTRWTDLKIDPLVCEHMMGHNLPGLLHIYDRARRDTEAAKAWELWGDWLQNVDTA